MQVEPYLRLHWDFLPPGDAHNRCDAAAAHFKKPQKKLIRDFAVLTTIGHLAFACTSLKNCYLIEAECTKFPDPLDCLVEEPWMREAFHFDYGVPTTATKYCAHQNALKYACCKKQPKVLPCVTIMITDREYKYVLFIYFYIYLFYYLFFILFFIFFLFFLFIFIYLFLFLFFILTYFSLSRLAQHTLWLDEEQKRDDDLDSLEENAFWDSPSRRRYHGINGPRVSQLSAESRKIYEYENNDDVYEDSSDDEVHSDDDFVDI
jgi:hypothetical protein